MRYLFIPVSELIVEFKMLSWADTALNPKRIYILVFDTPIPEIFILFVGLSQTSQTRNRGRINSNSNVIHTKHTFK